MSFVSSDRLPPHDGRSPTPASLAELQGLAGTGKDDPNDGPTLNWDEVGVFLHAISAAPRQWRAATLAIREEFSLKPRGPWILGLIAAGRAAFPSDLAKMFECSPGLITGELNRLIEGGLVSTRKHEPDARQLELTLTPLGEEVNKRIAKALVEMVHKRLTGYSKAEVMFCARLLRDFAAATNKP